MKREIQRVQCAGASEAQTACHEESTVFLVITEKLKCFLWLLMGPRTAAKWDDESQNL